MHMCILFTQRAVGTINLGATQETGDFFITFMALTEFSFAKHLYNIH